MAIAILAHAHRLHMRLLETERQEGTDCPKDGYMHDGCLQAAGKVMFHCFSLMMES